MVSPRDLSSGFGFTSMVGGTLFGLLAVMVSVLPAGGGGFATGSSMLLLALSFLIPGAVGLYVAHEPVLSLADKAAYGALLGGLSLSVLLSLIVVLGVASLPGPLLLGAGGLLLAGCLSFGAVIVRRDVLVHARSGGALLAAAIPLYVLITGAFGALGLDQPVLRSLLAALPFSGAWLLLGLDLLTADAGGVDVTVIREPD